ncbi:alpha/beta fold hydrolase [Vibrio ulleungensis]|uniref:Alpha/beta fold hydrolase n=1 Tax=Vibrio ulleungensis TaxID=2807619 RepID=A0ABS2HJ85_9VIBR|nr:alpha/beta fold hydrolase [Vibrio ulleungensis]MBM7037580.1 alpha/beta fold hydrolase [Vibrio ulleungensis]
MSLDHSQDFTQEAQFVSQMQGPIADFWAAREQGFLPAIENKKLYWVKFTSPKHSKAIVMVNGRTETVLKYQELFFDLFQQGYDVYSFDHRGQGLSDRVAHNAQMGHVEEFDHYVRDLSSMIDHFDLGGYQQRFLLGHSMGGAITTRFLQTHDCSAFNAAALSAPMFGIYLPAALKPIARGLSKWMAKLIPTTHYAVGQSGFDPKPFENNTLSHSKVRYAWADELHLNTEQIQMGGPTSHWVWQAMDGAKLCVENAAKIPLPLLIMQGEEDLVVDNLAHGQFMEHAPASTKLIVIKGARHELLVEADKMRNQAMNEILQWFDNHTDSAD